MRETWDKCDSKGNLGRKELIREPLPLERITFHFSVLAWVYSGVTFLPGRKVTRVESRKYVIKEHPDRSLFQMGSRSISTKAFAESLSFLNKPDTIDRFPAEMQKCSETSRWSAEREG